RPKMRSLMMKTCTTIVTVTGAACMLLAGAGCSSDSHEPADSGTGTGGSSGADAGVDTGPPAPMDIVAAGVRWVGRVDITTDAAHPRFAWSGTGFVAKFMGTSLTAQLAISGTTQIFKTVIDGTPQAPFTAAANTSMMWPLATGLTS